MSLPLEPLQPTRDSVTTIREDGSRRFLFPADVRGRFDRARAVVGWVLIAIYAALPWIQVGSHPAVFLDVAGRRFHLFGWTLALQDTFLLFFAITGLGFALFFLTALLGRVWCGWACPQTVFLDQIIRRIERWIDGDATARRRLAAAPWTTSKVLRRVAKEGAFVVCAALIAHLFLAYFVSLPALWGMMTASPATHASSFVFILLFTGILYFNFAWFREQLCLVICPYGRLQSVLLDDHSLIVGYDTRRGEPRGKAKSKAGTPVREPTLAAAAGVGEGTSGAAAAGALGDCVDCRRCVQVCPTGIDIRQGLQMECIACTACVDACDEIMTKLKRPTGLVRYASQASLAGGRTRWIRPRTLIYSGFLLLGAGVALAALATVHSAHLAVTRMVGAPYYLEDAAVRNQFLVRLINKRDTPVRLQLQVLDAPVPCTVTGFPPEGLEVAGLGEVVRPLVVQVARTDYKGGFPFQIVAREQDGRTEVRHRAEFLGPDRAWREDEHRHDREKAKPEKSEKQHAPDRKEHRIE